MNANFQINKKIIKTKRLSLRSFNKNDLDDFFEYASVPGVGEMAGWSHHKNKEESKKILDIFISEDKTFAIVNSLNNKVIGSIGIEKYGSEDKLTEFDGYIGREIGFVLSKDYWGQGYMKEAVQAVINYLFDDLHYDFLLCGHFDNNNQSRRVQEKLGFKPYRHIISETRMGTKEPTTLNLLINPNKKIELKFTHPETLIYK